MYVMHATAACIARSSQGTDLCHWAQLAIQIRIGHGALGLDAVEDLLPAVADWVANDKNHRLHNRLATNRRGSEDVTSQNITKLCLTK